MRHFKNAVQSFIIVYLLLLFSSCQHSNSKKYQLITLDPAHFHAALVQKKMYPNIDSVVYVYAPEGLGLKEHIDYIDQYNTRENNPTHWIEKIYDRPDYFEKMLSEKKGDIVMISGNNKKKSTYIEKSIDNGFNILADKPMIIKFEDFDLLKNAFNQTNEKGTLLYDIMTERSVTATVIQREVLKSQGVFGELQKGTEKDPAITMRSIHRYFKNVSGKTLVRPDWFFDPKQQGGALVDVGTHLVDLVQWVCFPEISLDYKNDIKLESAKTWPTPITLSQFSNITKEDSFPKFLKRYVKDDSVLLAHGNGQVKYSIKGIQAEVEARWTYQVPPQKNIPGPGDSFYSLVRGTKANLEIKQGENDSWVPTLYIWPVHKNDDIDSYVDNLENLMGKLSNQFPGIGLKEVENLSDKKGWKVEVPQKYLLGHEAHFANVVERYLKYLEEGKLPEWEISGILTKYFITTKGLELANH